MLLKPRLRACRARTCAERLPKRSPMRVANLTRNPVVSRIYKALDDRIHYFAASPSKLNKLCVS